MVINMEQHHIKYLEEVLTKYKQGRLTEVEVKNAASSLGYVRIDVDKDIVWKGNIPYKLL